MSDIVIKVENLGKRYIIGHHVERDRYVALRDVLMQKVGSFWHKTKDLAQGKPFVTGDRQEEFWALKDVSFEVRRGETVGIIGRNGAGKSTLLKILSRITEPSVGRVTILGRVASLLEVGTGFHPELTGRENVYLNGAILGMPRAEVARKFDEIVAFAEVEKFLDTPVKRYSSGMYVRLAFAVAAHLEPEILVVDEVLAVGDATFQKKCLGKMSDVVKNGRTVLFVSHNMTTIENLCPISIMLQNGKISLHSDTASVIDEYLKSASIDMETKPLTSDEIDLVVDILDQDGAATNCVKCGLPLSINLDIYPKKVLSKMDFTVAVFNSHGQRILTFDTRYQIKYKSSITKRCKYGIAWHKNILCPGDYVLGIGIYENGQYLTGWEHALALRVLESDYYGTGKLPDSGQGHILTDVIWSIQQGD